MSEFINTDDVVTGGSQDGNGDYWGYILIVLTTLLLIVLLMNYFGEDCAAMFQGSFPIKSDIGSDKFDLQKEVEKLTEKQMNNLGYV